MMSHKRLYIAAAIVAVLVLISFLVSVPRAEDGEVEALGGDVQAVAPEVQLTSAYAKGVYTISGTVLAPDVCAAASAEARPVGDPATGIEVAITLSESEDVCLEVPTKQRFSTTITAPAELPIVATVNGVPVSIAP